MEILKPHSLTQFVGEWRRITAKGVQECRRVVHEPTASGAMRAELPAGRDAITDWVHRLAGEALDEQRGRTVVATTVDVLKRLL